MTDPDHQRSPGSDGVPPPVLDTTRARGANTLGAMRYVVAAGIALVVIGFLIAYFVA
jgi:hypothetical protein